MLFRSVTLYAMATLFRIDNIVLSHSGGAPLAVYLLLSLLFFMNKLFKSRVAASSALLALCSLNLVAMVVYQRAGLTMPQEFAVVFMFPAIYFLWDYIHTYNKTSIIYFSLNFIMVWSMHFFPAIALCIFAFVFFLVHIVKILHQKKMFARIAVSVIASLAIVAAPMLYGNLILGKEWEHSLLWALSTIGLVEYTVPGTATVENEEGLVINAEETDNRETRPMTLSLLKEKLNWKNLLMEYKSEFGGYTHPYWFIVHVIILVVWLIYLIVLAVMRKNVLHFRTGPPPKDPYDKNYYSYKNNEYVRQKYSRYLLGHFGFFAYVVIIDFIIFCPYFGLPQIIEKGRLVSFVDTNMALTMAVPIEIFMALSFKKERRLIPSLVSMMLVGTLSYGAVHFDLLAKPSYSFQAQYNGAVIAYRRILNEFPRQKWTIVSPVDENTMVIGKGWHTELWEFITDLEDNVKARKAGEEPEPIYIPTPYVFFYLEKKPLRANRVNFYAGEMAKDEPPLTIEDSMADLDAELNKHVLDLIDKRYTIPELRRVYEGKLKLWIDKYQKYYPRELTLYYEDKDIWVYKLEQNEFYLNDLDIDYYEAVKGETN